MHKIFINVIEFIALNAVRALLIGMVLPFAFVGFMICLPNRDFRKDLFTRG